MLADRKELAKALYLGQNLCRKQKSKMRSQKSSTGHKKTKTKGEKKERKKIKAYQRELEELNGERHATDNSYAESS